MRPTSGLQAGGKHKGSQSPFGDGTGAIQVFLVEHRLQLMQAGVALAVLLLAVGVGYLFSVKKPLYTYLLVGAPFALVGGLFIERRLYLAPLVTLFVAGFIRFSLSTGTGSPLVLSLLLSIVFVGLWFLRMLVVERYIALKPSWINLPALGFIAAATISLVWSNIFRDNSVVVPGRFIFVQAASLVVFVISPAMMLLAANHITSARILKLMTGVMIAVGAIGLANNLLHLNLPINTSGLASMWVMAFSVGLVLFDAKIQRGLRVFLALLAAGWFYYSFIVSLSWLAGWLPAMAALIIVVVLRSRKLALVCLIALALYVAMNQSAFESNFSNESKTSGDTRLSAWMVNWQYTSEHLLFGMGPAGYAVYYMTYNPMDAMATHNNYLDVISQTGVVGSVFFLGMFGVLMWRGVVVYLRVRGRRDFLEAFSVAVLGGAAGCILIMGFGDWMLPFAYTQTIAGYNYSVYNWIFLGTILALDLMTDPKRAKTGLTHE